MYQDYLYQTNVYRDKYNEFSIAKNEYLKFETLTSETTAIVKTREMMAQRARLLQAYLLFLKARLNESTVNEKDKSMFQTLIDNNIKFLENHTSLIESIATIKDAEKANQDMERQYGAMSVAIRQIIIGLTESRLEELEQEYSSIMMAAQILMEEAKQELPTDRHILLDRWFQRISNKRSLFLQKLQIIQEGRKTLENSRDIHQRFEEVVSVGIQARQEFQEGIANMKELMSVMKYKDYFYE